MRARSSAVLAAATTCFEPDGHQARAGGGSDGAGTDCYASIKADLSCRCQHLSKAKTPSCRGGRCTQPAIIDRMSANICRDTATSAIWNVLRTGDRLAAAIKLFVSDRTLLIFVA